MSVTWPITGRLTVEYIVEARLVADPKQQWLAIGSYDTREWAEDISLSLEDPRFEVRVRQHLSQEPR